MVIMAGVTLNFVVKRLCEIYLSPSVPEAPRCPIVWWGAAALPLARDLQPAVILLDINMPGMDGIEVSQRLRDDPATAHIPIIVMSAQDRLRATGPLMPVNDRLPKPFDLTVLYATVARWAQAS